MDAQRFVANRTSLSLVITTITLLSVFVMKAQSIAAERTTASSVSSIFVEPLTTIPSNQGSVYYVSSRFGSDSNDGRSPARPFKRINHALYPWETPQFKGGDVIVVMPGTYYETIRFENPAHAGSTSAYTTLMAAPGQERPVIIGNQPSADGGWNGSCNGCGAVNVWIPYVRVSGFDISAPNRSPVSDGVHIGPAKPADRVHHVTIDNNVVHDSSGGGIVAVFSDYIVIRNNLVHNNAKWGANQPSGITIGYSLDFDLNPGYHNAIVENISYNNMNMVPANYSVFTCPSSQANCHTDGNGIILDDNRRTQIDNIPYRSRSLIFGNTVFDNGGRGIAIYSTDNVDVVNNTSYRNLKDTLLLNYPRYNGELDIASANAVNLYNNIAGSRNSAIAAISQKDSTGVTWKNNLLSVGTVYMYRNGSPSIDLRQNKIGSDPRFVVPSINPVTANFHLPRSSPAYAAGIVLPEAIALPGLAGTTLSFLHSATGVFHRFVVPYRPNIGAYLR